MISSSVIVSQEQDMVQAWPLSFAAWQDHETSLKSMEIWLSTFLSSSGFLHQRIPRSIETRTFLASVYDHNFEIMALLTM
jgi:hypothetical protein